MALLPRSVGPRKLPARIQARLAGAIFRAARKAADDNRCQAAELMVAFGSIDLHGAATRVRTPSATLKPMDATIEAADAGQAILECHRRAREPKGDAPT